MSQTPCADGAVVTLPSAKKVAVEGQTNQVRNDFHHTVLVTNAHALIITHYSICSQSNSGGIIRSAQTHNPTSSFPVLCIRSLSLCLWGFQTADHRIFSHWGRSFLQDSTTPEARPQSVLSTDIQPPFPFSLLTGLASMQRRALPPISAQLELG